MKTLKLTLTILAVFVFAGTMFSSCNLDNDGLGSLVVVLPGGGGAARAGAPITGEDYDSFAKLTYYIECTASGRPVRQRIYPGETSISLAPGNWDVTVTVYYENYLNKALGRKTEKSVAITSGATKQLPMEITIKTDLIVSFAMSWDNNTKRAVGIVTEDPDPVHETGVIGDTGGTGGETIPRTGTITVRMFSDDYAYLFSNTPVGLSPAVTLDFVHTGISSNPESGGDPIKADELSDNPITITAVGETTERTYYIEVEEIQAGLSITDLTPGEEYVVYIFDKEITSMFDFAMAMFTNCKAIGYTEDTGAARNFYLLDSGKIFNFGSIFDPDNVDPEVFDNFDFTAIWEGTGNSETYWIVLVSLDTETYYTRQASFAAGIIVDISPSFSSFTILDNFSGTLTVNNAPSDYAVIITTDPFSASSSFSSVNTSTMMASGSGEGSACGLYWFGSSTGTFHVCIMDMTAEPFTARFVNNVQFTNGTANSAVNWNSMTPCYP